jgi:hypothetical protein
LYWAQFTQYKLSGPIRILPIGIGFLHFRQMPKSLLPNFSKTALSLSSFSSACRNAASITALLLIASMRDILPMTTSVASGLADAL